MIELVRDLRVTLKRGQLQIIFCTRQHCRNCECLLQTVCEVGIWALVRLWVTCNCTWLVSALLQLLPVQRHNRVADESDISCQLMCCICYVRYRSSTQGFEPLVALLPIDVEVFVRVEDDRHLLPERVLALRATVTVETHMGRGVRFSDSQCTSEGTAAPPEPKAAPRSSLCKVSSAAAPALVMKSDWASPRSSHEPVGATVTVETHMGRGVRFLVS